MRRRLLTILFTLLAPFAAHAEWLITECSAYTPYDNNSCLCFLPKDKNIFALRTCARLDGVGYLLPKSELSIVFPTDTIINKKTKACLLKTANGELAGIIAPIRQKK